MAYFFSAHMITTILGAQVEFIDQPFLKPLRISAGLITKATEARAMVRVRTGSREAVGRGSIYLSDLWAWPGMTPDRDAKDSAMRRLCETIAAALADWCGGEPAHPLELGLRLHHSLGSPEIQMPLLARSVCASAFDAAIHDAAGQALGLSAFHFYDAPAAIPSADAWFPGTGAAEAIRRSLRKPARRLNAWRLVSAGDDLEQVRPAVMETGIHCYKIKLLARDAAEDGTRTSEVFQAARSWGQEPTLSADSNEGNPDPESVSEYLDALEALDASAYAALSYLEQPTARDIVAHPHDWRGSRKDILLDEGLTSLDLLPIAREQGWSGFALKTCKGHSFTLATAAWALQNGMKVSMQDLTNPGYSGVHSFLLAAHLPCINGVELNSPQYTPAANLPWLPALSGIFEPRSGVHAVDDASCPGLGSSLKPL
jgi:L-alanine-DL-glutamate epimerase-like enolase superfamily enzyme